MSNNKKEKRISLDEADLGFADEVAAEPGGEEIKKCFSCGTCTSGCPVNIASPEYNPRKILRLVITGQRDTVLQSDFIWHCSTCYTCHERCPQGVHLPSVMTALRNIAAREGYLPAGYARQSELILDQGRLYEIDDFDNKKRGKAGLPGIVTDSSLVAQIKQSIEREDAASEDMECSEENNS